MPISLPDVRRIASLASLDVDESEAARLREELRAILDHFSHLRDMDPDAACGLADDGDAPLRPDVVTEEPRAGTAPIRVPRVVDP